MVIYGPPLGHDSVPETWKPSLNISDSNLTIKASVGHRHMALQAAVSNFPLLFENSRPRVFQRRHNE